MWTECKNTSDLGRKNTFRTVLPQVKIESRVIDKSNSAPSWCDDQHASINVASGGSNLPFTVYLVRKRKTLPVEDGCMNFIRFLLFLKTIVVFWAPLYRRELWFTSESHCLKEDVLLCTTAVKKTKQVIHRLLFSVQSPVGEMLLAGWVQNETHFQMWQTYYAGLCKWDFGRPGESTDVMSGKKIQGFCWKKQDNGGSLLSQTTCIIYFFLIHQLYFLLVIVFKYIFFAFLLYVYVIFISSLSN